MSYIAGLDRFSTVSLDELNERAPLLDRQENKYVVSADTLSEVVAELAGEFDMLRIDDCVEFTYETTYYDTGDLLTYRHHAQNRRRRFKVRSRHYVDSGDCYFEIKLKGSQGRTLKERFPYDPQRHGRIDREAINFVRERVRETYGQSFDHPLVPTLNMRYQRVTLVGRDRPERATIDFALAFSTPDGPTVLAPKDLAIVEVKSIDGRGRADRAFREAGVRSMGCSKYCVGLNMVNNDLRYNQFKTVLIQHFGWAPPDPPPAVIRHSEPVTAPIMAETYRRVVDLLIAEFGPEHAAEARLAVQQEGRQLEGARVRSFIEILLHRAARRELIATRSDQTRITPASADTTPCVMSTSKD